MRTLLLENVCSSTLNDFGFDDFIRYHEVDIFIDIYRIEIVLEFEISTIEKVFLLLHYFTTNEV